MNTSDSSLRILSIDVGGSGIKACLLDPKGNVTEDFRKIPTPKPATPAAVLEAIGTLVSGFPGFDCISLGFPGYVRDEKVFTAPNLDNAAWAGFPLGAELTRIFGKPARVVNDADLQGLGIARGQGLEMVMTLGTGFGTALMLNGKLLPHLELAHLPASKSKDFDAYIGEAALLEVGEKKWNERMERVLDIFRTVVNYDQLFISGGNAKKLRVALGPNVHIVSNREGIRGGARLWNHFAAS